MILNGISVETLQVEMADRKARIVQQTSLVNDRVKTETLHSLPCPYFLGSSKTTIDRNQELLTYTHTLWVSV